jgi:hypothetical protein
VFGLLAGYAARFNDAVYPDGAAAGIQEYLAALLVPRDRNKMLTALA